MDPSADAAEIVRNFLRAECQLLRLAAVAGDTVAAVESFLSSTADVPTAIYRSSAGEVLVRAASDDLLITGKTAEVLCAYIDCRVVSTEDRLDMTLRRTIAL